MDQRSAIRRRVGSPGGRGLGPVSLRALGVDGFLWMDVGRMRALGMGSVSLRQLVPGLLRLGLVPGADSHAALLEARAGRLLWVGRIRRVQLWFRQRGMGTPGSA